MTREALSGVGDLLDHLSGNILHADQYLPIVETAWVLVSELYLVPGRLGRVQYFTR